MNGLAQFSVSIVRAIGPAMANSLFSVSIDPTRHYLGGYLVYWVLSGVTCLAVVAGTYLPRKVWGPEDEDESH